ncbi:PAS domain S-box protein [Planktothrix sp. FACHB-1365]|uniref:PAS domain S-box protein n=1 Tax=Planktothrix sp. FACHB-1365 TaxID=2692855 RepID=UPI001684A16F|nr:PAS domain S-box protein [Planktothrix sp. FACHB-1365]MBD2482557.1 PAS domain S-box protein [Planktothrix sp. FACHB-1365]
MSNRVDRCFLPYIVAIVNVGLALALMLGLDQWLGMKTTPFLLFFGAIVLSASYGGLRSGLLATGLSAVLSQYFFMYPLQQWGVTLSDLIRITIFIIQGIALSLLCDDKLNYYDFIIEPIRESIDKIIGITGVAVNITEPKKTEKELYSAHQRVGEILESITDSFFAVDQKWRFTYINQKFEEISGFSRIELLGKCIWDKFPHTVDSIFYQQYHQAVANKIPVTVEGEVKEGSGRWFIAHAYPSGEGLAVYLQEISDRKQTQQILQETQDRLSLALTAAKMMVWDSDLTTRKVVCSENAQEIWGFQQGTFEDFINLIYPDDQDSVLQAFRNAITSQDLYRIEYRIIKPDYKIHWLRSQGKVYFNSQGKPIRFIGVSFDITERKQMEEAIQESEQRFRATFNQAAVGIAQVALDGQFIEVNPALCKITGYSHQELSQMNFQEITHPDDLEQDWELARQVLAREIPRYSLEKRYFCKDNSITWVNLTSSVVWDEFTGIPKYAVGIIEDISERKKVEASQQFLVEASQILSSSLDYEATLIQLGYLAVPLLGDWCIVDLLKEEGIMQDLAIVCYPPQKQALLCEMRQKYPPNAALQNPWVEQIRLGKSLFYPQIPPSLLWEIAQDHQHLQLLEDLKIDSLIIVPLRCRGKILGSLSFAMSESGRYYDSSDLALAEDVARRAASTIDNARLYQETERANRIKDEFLAILSHELRTPLNPILGWAKLLRTRKYDEETRQKALEIIERNTKLEVQLVEDLLDISRILQGKLHLTISPVNLVTIIESSLETVRLAAQGKSINLTFLIPENSNINLNSSPIFQHLNLPQSLQNQLKISPPFLVLGDSGRLQQMMWNLLSNAVKFTPTKGEIKIELSLVQTPDPYAQIQVMDTGKGITSDFLPYIFDYFRQADGAINRQYGGLGLGLAIVRHVVELHGGTIVAESPGENQGSTFTVRLPLAYIPQKQQLNPQPDFLQDNDNTDEILPLNSVLQGTRILVVDDEADTRDLLVFILQQQGAKVEAVASALKALQLLSQFQPDLCLFDIGMPVIDGYMLIRKIRSLPIEQGGKIPAIALTAYATEIDQQKSLTAGFQCHLPKPIEPNELITAISELLQQPQNCPEGTATTL